MEDWNLVQWLLQEGGPAIRYRTAVELIGKQESGENEQLTKTLLQTEKVQWLLKQMDSFGPIERVDIGVLNALHGMQPTCLENVIARLLELGLRVGLPVFDTKMERFRQYVTNPLVRQALDTPEQPTVEGWRAVFIAIILASYFMRGGYRYDEVIEFVERRTDRLSRLAAERNYAIHLPETELDGLPKQWVGKSIIRPEMDPTIGTTPLPLIHDIFACAYVPTERLSEQTRQKLGEIIAYVTDDRYRSFPPGYGYLWLKAHSRICYACGWNLDLPNLDTPNPSAQRKIVQRLELLAHFPAARQSSWFQQGMELLETFRTERGTYCFPRAYLLEMKTGYYVGGEYMGLEENRRTVKALELESTFRMLLLKKFVNTNMVSG